MGYNLGVLNDKEFEDLAKDLLDSKLGVEFEIFKAGKDGGIDLRYSKRKPNEILVQVKHYVNSKFSDLTTQLKLEKKKIDKLSDKPSRYMVFTSLPLNPRECDEIKKILSPYIRTTSDIYSKRRVDLLISKYHDIEQKYFKLWLTSTNILKRVLNNAVVNSSEFQSSLIVKRCKFYVHTENINKALIHLEANKFLIISGEPGVGKTTLAYMLVYDMMAKGFQLIYSDRNLRETEDLLSIDPRKKQVIFIDDFLGSNLHDIYNPVNSEKSIVRFIEQIKVIPNKYLIFTSRTTILKQAYHYFESFQRENIGKVSNYELKITGYSKLDKARILYNHLFHFNLSASFKDVFYENKNYLKIINHKNYYPRLIEALTKETNFEQSGFDTPEEFIFTNLDNPSKIWESAFDRQLTREDQILLETIFTFGDRSVNKLIIEQAFENRYSYELANGSLTFNLNAFNHSLRKLMDGFLNSQLNVGTGEILISFINPSVTDFFMNYLKSNHSENYRIWSSAKYIDQLIKTFGNPDSKLIKVRKHERDKYFITFVGNLNSYQSIFSNDSTAFYSLYFLWRMFWDKLLSKQDILIRLFLEMLNIRNQFDTTWFCLILIDIHVDNFTEAKDFILGKWTELLNEAIINTDDPDDLRLIVDLHVEYDLDFASYLEDEDLSWDFYHAVTIQIDKMLKDASFESVIDLESLENRGQSYVIDRIEEEAFEICNQFLNDHKLLEYVDSSRLDYTFDAFEVLSNFLSSLSYDANDRRISRTSIPSNDLNISESSEIERIFSRD